MQFECVGTIKLPLIDPDGDKVKCRWGNTIDECGSVCAALPGVILDEVSTVNMFFVNEEKPS